MQYLRTNTATRITVGPFLDATDGVTPEIALTVTACLLTLVVDTGGVPTLVLDIAPTASGGSNDMVHITSDAAGYYDLELAAADVNYLGRARLAITDAANHCPVFMEFMILPAVVYDALVLGTDLLQTDVTQLLGTAWLPPNTAGTPDVNAIELGDAPVTATTSVTFAAASTVAYTTGPVGSVAGNVAGSVDSVTGDTKQTADVATLITTVGVAGLGLSDLGGMSTAMKAEVNVEVADVIKTDTIADLAQGLPPATPTFEEAVMYLYSALRNSGIADKTAGEKQFHNDAGTLIWKKAVTKTATDYTEAKGVTGP